MQVNNTSSLEKLLLDIDRLKDSIAHQRSDDLNKQQQEEALKDPPPVVTSDEGLQTDNFLASLITSPPDQPLSAWGASDQTSFLDALSHTGSMQTQSSKTPNIDWEAVAKRTALINEKEKKDSGKGMWKGMGKGKKAGSGLRSETPSLYEMNTNGAMNRLMLLIGGKKAGNTSQVIKQEAATILDWLLNNNKINIDEHKLLTQEVNS